MPLSVFFSHMTLCTAAFKQLINRRIERFRQTKRQCKRGGVFIIFYRVHCLSTDAALHRQRFL